MWQSSSKPSSPMRGTPAQRGCTLGSRAGVRTGEGTLGRISPWSRASLALDALKGQPLRDVLGRIAVELRPRGQTEEFDGRRIELVAPVGQIDDDRSRHGQR